MVIKSVDTPENAYVLVSYESGHTALWDLRERTVVSWMKIDECPMAVSFDNYWMRGVIGSPADKLEVRAQKFLDLLIFMQKCILLKKFLNLLIPDSKLSCKNS